MGWSAPWWARRAGTLAVPAATVAAWQLASWAAGPDFLPSPWAAAGRALAGFREGWLWQELALTLMELAGGDRKSVV